MVQKKNAISLQDNYGKKKTLIHNIQYLLVFGGNNGQAKASHVI